MSKCHLTSAAVKTKKDIWRRDLEAKSQGNELAGLSHIWLVFFWGTVLCQKYSATFEIHVKFSVFLPIIIKLIVWLFGFPLKLVIVRSYWCYLEGKHLKTKWPVLSHVFADISVDVNGNSTSWKFLPLLKSYNFVNSEGNNMSPLMTKPTKWHVRPAKAQISLGSHAILLVLSLGGSYSITITITAINILCSCVFLWKYFHRFRY